jgi:hypothetical protein
LDLILNRCALPLQLLDASDMSEATPALTSEVVRLGQLVKQGPWDVCTEGNDQFGVEFDIGWVGDAAMEVRIGLSERTVFQVVN